MNSDMDRSFLEASIDDLFGKLTFEEKVGLLAGHTWWETKPIPRLNIPSIKVTDGPNGARGGSFSKPTPGLAFPNATCLASTFSSELVHNAAALLAEEVKARKSVCLLAPTVNIARSPSGGRVFEAFSEDPTLSGLMAAAYVNGLQDNNVSATIKHFVGNDQEHERTGSDSVVSPRALREIYLRPFQIAQHLAKPGAYMSGYNKLNGTHCSENRWLLNDLLRKEWKHDGLIMSDWYGTYSVAGAINAGLDLEMPGPAIWRGMRQVNHLINAHKLDMPAIDARVRAVLRWVQTWAQRNTELVYSEDAEERTRDESKENDAKVLRKLAVEGIVLLKNDRNVLPIQQGKVAVIGPTAKTPLITGGGSAILRASWVVSPWQGLSDNCPSDVALSYAPGCIGTQFLPVLGEQFTCVDDMPGFNVYHYCIVNGRQEALPAISEVALSSDMPMEDLQDDRLTTQFCTEFKAIFTAPIDGQYEFGLAVTGQGRLWVDDKLVVDNSKDQERGDAFSGLATTEVRGRLEVCKGKQYSIRMLHDSRPPIVSQPALPFGAVGVRLGACPVVDHDCLIEEAVALAKTVDKAVIFCGLGPEWESEGFDRPTLSLPLRQNEMISRVSQANPNTVVVLQAGSAVTMPWNNDVAGIMQAWYGGNEAGNAIADIVYGRVNPSGRLPLTFPARDQDTAAFLNSKSARTAVHYEEGIWIGYKHHHARGIPPLFPFGHGLSYTTFEYSNIETAAPACGTTAQEWRVQVKAMITNTGESTGSHSVHFYTCPPPETRTGLKHPPHSLQAIANVTDLRPGESETVSVTLDKYAISHWDEMTECWKAETGAWSVKIGKDAHSLIGDASFVVDRHLEWRGL